MQTTRDYWGMLYVSAVSLKLAKEEMALIKQEVTRDCRSKDITGLLIHAEGNLLCYMEGTKDTLALQYKQIITDVRHKNLVKLFDGPIPFRFFDEFGMSFKFLDRAFSEFDDFNTEGTEEYLQECLNMNNIPMKQISQFIKNNK